MIRYLSVPPHSPVSVCCSVPAPRAKAPRTGLLREKLRLQPVLNEGAMLAAEGTDVALNHRISARLSGADRLKSNSLSTPPKERRVGPGNVHKGGHLTAPDYGSAYSRTRGPGLVAANARIVPGRETVGAALCAFAHPTQPYSAAIDLKARLRLQHHRL
jgi:hypothetical protein